MQHLNSLKGFTSDADKALVTAAAVAASSPSKTAWSLRRQGGFTLLEAIIYIALFMFVIGGGVLSAYQIFDGSAEIKRMNIVEAEANFLQRKFDWALNGSSITTPSAGAEGNTLVVVKEGTTYTFALGGDGVVSLNDGSGAVPLSTDNVTVSNLRFRHVAAGSEPESISFSFVIDERFVGTTTRYVR